jgi:hypothetical protein
VLNALNPDGRAETGQDITVLDNDWLCIEHLGLTLAEAKEASLHDMGKSVREALVHLVS